MTLPWDLTPIRTSRLLIRPMTLDDVDAVYAYQSRDDVTAYLLHGPLTRETLEERLGLFAAATRIAVEGDWVGPAIEADGRVVGHLVLGYSSAERLGGEIGWCLHPDAQGHGYATEAAGALLDAAFGPLGLHRVRAELDPRNTASIGVCRRLGMRQEALRRRDILDERGRWRDTAEYALLVDEWRRTAH